MSNSLYKHKATVETSGTELESILKGYSSSHDPLSLDISQDVVPAVKKMTSRRRVNF